MADYGVYLTTTDGRPFITSNSIPVSLLTKATASASGKVSVSVNIDPSMVNIPFVLSDAPAFPSYSIVGSVMTITCHRTSDTGGAINMQVYVFSTKVPVPPKWGIALWNAQGKCILTNETRVLRDIRTIGTKGVPASSGTSINQTITGKWAILPDLAGQLSGVVNQGPFSIVQPFFAQYNGTSTVISSILASNIPVGGQGSLTNTQNSVKCIDASLYD